MRRQGRFSHNSNHLRRFGADQRGGTAVLFGLSLVPALASVGAAIDISAAYKVRTELQNALDSAALAAAQDYRDNQSTTSAQARASQIFAAARPPGVDATLLPLSADPATGQIDVRATARARTQFAGAVFDAYRELPINAATRAIAGATAQGKNLEVSLMLDVTTSMSQNSGTSGLTKLQAMKQAARNFVNTVIQDRQTPYTSRAALAPFSSAVNVGAYFRTVTNTTATGSWTSVVERSGASAVSDDPPASGAYFPSYRNRRANAQSPNSFYANIERNRTSNIPVASYVRPLSSDKTALTTAIDALQANGTTAGHLGVAWSWYTLSPRWDGVWTTGAPAAYDPERTLKVAILMSDFDFNMYYQSANGDMNAQARALCANMKAAGVVVYTVGFQVDASLPDAVDLFQNCASDPSKAIAAQTGEELIAAYQTLAQTVRRSVASPVRLAR